MGITPSPVHAKRRRPPNRVARYARQLERLGWIKRSYRSSHEQESVVCFTINKKVNDERGLTISREILDLNIPTNKKFVLACKLAFPNMSRDVMAEHLGISHSRIGYELRWLKKQGYLDHFSNSQSHNHETGDGEAESDEESASDEDEAAQNHHGEFSSGTMPQSNRAMPLLIGILPTKKEPLGIVLVSLDLDLARLDPREFTSVNLSDFVADTSCNSSNVLGDSREIISSKESSKENIPQKYVLGMFKPSEIFTKSTSQELGMPSMPEYILGLYKYPPDGDNSKHHTRDQSSDNDMCTHDVSDSTNNSQEKSMRESSKNDNFPQDDEFDYTKYLVDCKDHKPPKKLPSISNLVMQELENHVFPHRYLATHHTHKQMLTAAKVVSALRRPGGLSNILDDNQIDCIVRYFSAKPNCFDPNDVKAVLRKQFSKEERLELYERLSNSMSPAYEGGKGKTVSLSQSAWSYGSVGFCRIVLVWLKPPKKKALGPPTPKVANEELAKVEKLIKDYLPEFNLQNWNLQMIKDLKKHYESEILPLSNQLKSNVSFPNWLNEFLSFTYNKARDENAPFHFGWLKFGGYAFLEFDKRFRSELVFEANSKARAESIKQAIEEREREERERAFKEAYGLL